MNNFKKSLRNEKYKQKTKKIKNKPQWQFYKTYKIGNKGNKVYQGKKKEKNELSQNNYLGGVSCFIIDEEGNILIERRGNTKITSGEVDLCSGHIDNNETPTQAMVREYVEELHRGNQKEQEEARNEAINNLKKLDELDLVFKNKGNERRFFIQFYVMKTKLKELTIQKEEISDVEWIKMDNAFELIRDGKTKFPYDLRYEKIFKQVREHYKEKDKQQDKEEWSK